MAGQARQGQVRLGLARSGRAGLASRGRFWFVAVRHGRRGRDWTGTFRRGGVWFNFLGRFYARDR